MPMRPPVPPAESARLRALADYRILDTEPEAGIDALARIAALVCGAPIALVNLIDRDRGWFKARVGTGLTEIPRNVAFCAYTIAARELVEVPDTRADPRFAANPLVVNDPALRFYAGAPLITPCGHALGTLCVADYAPRTLGADQRAALTALAGQVMSQLEQRRQNRRLQELVAASRDTERDLRIERAYLEQLFETAPEAIIVLDADDRVTRANGEFTRMFGYGRDEYEGRRITDLVVPPDRILERNGLTSTVASGSRAALETVRWRKDRTPVHVSILAAPISLDGGQVGVYGIYRDITERHRGEVALRESEAFARAVMDHMLEGLLIVDDSSTIISVNRAFERIFGYTREELLGQHLALLMPEDVRHRADDFLREARDQAIGRISEWRARRKNGEIFPFELSLFSFEASGRFFYAGAIRDVSERREVERLKQEFVATVSHELRTPLTSIRGALGLIAAGGLGELPPGAHELLTVAERNSVRLVTLINDILDLERLESGKIHMQFAEVPVAAVVRRAIEAVAGAAAAAEIRLVGPVDSAARAWGDIDRLTQVMVNLLSNAIKFSPAGSAVTVTATQTPQWVEVRVADQGRGVPAALHEVVFERFRQVAASDERDKGGTGLGLAICRAIIEQHQGLIGVESSAETGSTFWFRVPPSANRRPRSAASPS